MLPGQTLNESFVARCPGSTRSTGGRRPDHGRRAGGHDERLLRGSRGIQPAHPGGSRRSGPSKFDWRHPYPEEANRRMLTAVARPAFRADPMGQEKPAAARAFRGQIVVDGEHGRRCAAPDARHDSPARKPIRPTTDVGVLIAIHRRKPGNPAVARGESLMDGICSEPCEGRPIGTRTSTSFIRSI